MPTYEIGLGGSPTLGSALSSGRYLLIECNHIWGEGDVQFGMMQAEVCSFGCCLLYRRYQLSRNFTLLNITSISFVFVLFRGKI